MTKMRMIFSYDSVYVDDIIITFNPKSIKTSFQGELVFLIMMGAPDGDENIVTMLFG